MDDRMQKRYQLETALLRVERQSVETGEKRKQAKYDLRCRKDEALNYGGLRGFLDKLSGREADKREALDRSVRQAEAALNALQREQEMLNRQKEELSRELEALPALEELLTFENEKQWAVLEARFCCEALLPLLEENEKALLGYRKLIQGSQLEILTFEKPQAICTEPNVWGEKCRPLVLRLKKARDVLEIPFEVGGYYDSPQSYLVAVAAKHNRIDRVNQALDQVRDIKKTASKFLETV